MPLILRCGIGHLTQKGFFLKYNAMNNHVKESTQKQIRTLQKRGLLDDYIRSFPNLEQRILKRYRFLIECENLIPSDTVIILAEDYSYPKQFITKVLDFKRLQ